MADRVTERDLAILEEQLGRSPRGVRAIERRCSAGHPQVIRVYPLLDGKPFPTLYWLTCPSLIKQIARLEHQGWIERLERRMERAPEMRARYFESHRAYIEERWRELSEGDRQWVIERGLEPIFEERGIGGLRDWTKVKCLHLHYAHYQARGENVIGAFLVESFQITECPAE